MVHLLGGLQVIRSFGGIENTFIYYPHLQLYLTHAAYFETQWPILNATPLTRPKQASRRVVEMLCHASALKRRFYNPCPTALTLVMWDIGDLSSKILPSHKPISQAQSRRREEILLRTLAYRPEEGTQEVKESYYKDVTM
jgi:hypothetical protein